MWENWKSMEHEDDIDTNCKGGAWNNPRTSGKGTGRLGNREQVETTQTTESLRSEKYWGASWSLEETCSHSNSCEILVWITLKGE